MLVTPGAHPVREFAVHLARPVTVGDDTVEIAHEALIHGWPTLQDWLAADRESLRAYRRLTGAATDWARQGHDVAFLYGQPARGLGRPGHHFPVIHAVTKARRVSRSAPSTCWNGLVP